MSNSYERASTRITTKYGDFDFDCFKWSEHEEDTILCASRRPWGPHPLVRIQSACYTAEIFRSLDCDCHAQLDESLRRVASDGGIVLYMLCDGRGAGLFLKVQGLELGRTKGLDTADAYEALGLPGDLRTYARPAECLRAVGAVSIRLLTNNPRKIEGLQQAGLQVLREPIEIQPTTDSEPYLRTKALKMGHLLKGFAEPK
jgi:GTP cyclohydrolase II